MKLRQSPRPGRSGRASSHLQRRAFEPISGEMIRDDRGNLAHKNTNGFNISSTSLRTSSFLGLHPGKGPRPPPTFKIIPVRNQYLRCDQGVTLQIDDGVVLPPLRFRTCLPGAVSST